MDHVVKLWEEFNLSGNSGIGSLAAMIPDEIVEVEFARVFADLVAAPDFRNSSGSGTRIAGFLGQGAMNMSIASLSIVGASVRNAVAGKSEVSLVACTCPPGPLSMAIEDNLQDGDWSGIGDEGGTSEPAAVDHPVSGADMRQEQAQH